MTRREWIKRTLGFGAGAGLVVGGGSVAQAYSAGVVRLQHKLAGLREPLRVAFLTDLHYGLYMEEGSVRRWVDAAMSERPDLVLLGGDFVDIRAGETPVGLLRQLARLSAPLGVYGVWGNHDYGSFGAYDSRWRGRAGKTADIPRWREQLREQLAAAGVTILRNEAARPRADLHLVGTDDLWWGEPADLGALLEGAGERATLLLTHNPDILPRLPRHIGLTLAGHTHGGQVRLPFVGAVVVPSNYGTRFDMGWKTGAHGSPAYVSRGLGCSGLPVRTLCQPEITLLTLTA